MKAITVRGIDAELAAALRRQAEQTGASINAAILQLLRDGLGLTGRKFHVRHHDLDDLAGQWSEQERRSFDEVTSAFSRVDEELWR